MNFKNLVEILRYDFDYRLLHRSLREGRGYYFNFRGPNGVDNITTDQLLIIEKLQTTDVIKELLCLEKASPSI